MTNPVLTMTDIRAINHLAYKCAKRDDEIAAELNIPIEDVELVIKKRYVKHIEFKPVDEITLAEYEAIRAKFVPGKRSPRNEFALCKEFGIEPSVVLEIARGRFHNANTHPSRYTAPEPVEAVETAPERLMDADDIARGNKLLSMGWPLADIAADLGVDASRINTLKRVKLNNWPLSDALSLVNRGL